MFKTTSKIWDDLTKLIKKSPMAIHEFSEKCRNPCYQMFGQTPVDVQKLGLMNSDGSVDELVRKVTLFRFTQQSQPLDYSFHPLDYSFNELNLDEVLHFKLPELPKHSNSNSEKNTQENSVRVGQSRYSFVAASQTPEVSVAINVLNESVSKFGLNNT